MVAAITRAASLPRKAKLALQFSGIAPTQVSQSKSSFCHAEHGRLSSLALSVRRVCHTNESAEREPDTEKSVAQGSDTEKVVEDGHHEEPSDAVTYCACPTAQEEVSK